jgi:hypothetical protein
MFSGRHCLRFSSRDIKECRSSDLNHIKPGSKSDVKNGARFLQGAGFDGEFLLGVIYGRFKKQILAESIRSFVVAVLCPFAVCLENSGDKREQLSS